MNTEELQKLTVKKLISIGKNLKIKYLTQMKKEEIIDEILNKEFDILVEEVPKKKSFCKHNKYKCKTCRENSFNNYYRQEILEYGRAYVYACVM